MLKQRPWCPQCSSETISDIYDGEEYLKLCEPGGFLCPYTNPVNISFTLNTDGVPLFSSSQTGIWPVYLVINELPPHARYGMIILIMFVYLINEHSLQMLGLL